MKWLQYVNEALFELIYTHLLTLFVFSYLIPFNFTEEKKTLIFVPFSDRLSLEEWEQQMACWKTHLARAPAGKSFFCFCDRQHKRHWFNREEQNSIGFHPSPQVHVLQFLTWLVTAWWWGGVPRSERHQIVFPPMTLHWHQHSGETRKQKEEQQFRCWVNSKARYRAGINILTCVRRSMITASVYQPLTLNEWRE